MVISIFGDSILKGICLEDGQYKLQSRAVRELEAKNGLSVRNHCRFGATVQKGMDILRRNISKEGLPACTLLAFGNDDSDYIWADLTSSPAGDHSFRTTPEDFESEYIALIRKVRANGSEPVLMTLPPIIADRYLAWRCEKERLDRNTVLNRIGDISALYRRQERYNRSIEAIARKTSCRIIDIRTVFLNHAGPLSNLLCEDGVHPNLAGLELIYREIRKSMPVAA